MFLVLETAFVTLSKKLPIKESFFSRYRCNFTEIFLLREYVLE